MYYNNYNHNGYQDEPIEAPGYHIHSDEPPKPKKKRLGVKITAACLACALVGGLAGGGVTLFASRQDGTVDGPTIYDSTHTPAAVNVSNIKTGTPLTLSEIYAANVGSTVGITTELVTTNLWGQRVSGAAAGSGFVITSDGYIVTNYHVISGANSIKVAFSDGKEYEAELVGGEKDNDIAVLKIEAEGLIPVKLGDSDNLLVGEQVAAIGNPLGELTYTLTSGYVSALNRPVTISNNIALNMIQTDTAINSGNSGGPLFNMYGEVIGITSAKLSNNNASSEATIEGLGFAIPINDVKNMITSIIKNGYVTGKAYLGISAASDATMQQYNLGQGVLVAGVTEGSAADKAGLQRGDIITAIGDKKIASYSDLKIALNQYQAGDTTDLTVDRNGETVNTKITFDEAPQEQQEAPEETQSQQQEPQGGYYSEWPFGGFFPFQ